MIDESQIEYLQNGEIVDADNLNRPLRQIVSATNDSSAGKANTSTQVIAGTGLSGGGNLSANRTLAVSYGTTAGTSVQGNDTRVVNAVPNSRTITVGTGLTGGGNLSADRTLSVIYGTAASTAAQGNDSRINNGQTAFGWGNHASAGYAKTKADVGLSGIPNTNASTANFLRGDGTWATPPNTNTTYAEITTAEIDAGTAATLCTISGRRMKYALDKKANTSHTHPWAEVTGQPVTATRWPTWAEVTGKPATYTPSTHTHSYLPLTGGTVSGSLSVSGDITATGNITAYSDRRLKYDVSNIDNPLDKVRQLTGYTYSRYDIDDERQTGLMAQDVLGVLPEAVRVDSDGMLMVSYGNIVGLLVETIKELDIEINKLKEKQ